MHKNIIGQFASETGKKAESSIPQAVTKILTKIAISGQKIKGLSVYDPCIPGSLC